LASTTGPRLVGSGVPYAEAAHIRPLGAPHDGPDSYENLICLCPNHHTLFDIGGFTIADDLSLIGIDGKLHIASDAHAQQFAREVSPRRLFTRKVRPSAADVTRYDVTIPQKNVIFASATSRAARKVPIRSPGPSKPAQFCQGTQKALFDCTAASRRSNSDF
jgi:hypothetical protein